MPAMSFSSSFKPSGPRSVRGGELKDLIFHTRFPTNRRRRQWRLQVQVVCGIFTAVPSRWPQQGQEKTVKRRLCVSVYWSCAVWCACDAPRGRVGSSGSCMTELCFAFPSPFFSVLRSNRHQRCTGGRKNRSQHKHSCLVRRRRHCRPRVRTATAPFGYPVLFRRQQYTHTHTLFSLRHRFHREHGMS